MILLDMKSWARWLGVFFLLFVLTGVIFGTQSIIYWFVGGFWGIWLMGPFLLAIWNIGEK